MIVLRHIFVASIS